MAKSGKYDPYQTLKTSAWRDRVRAKIRMVYCYRKADEYRRCASLADIVTFGLMVAAGSTLFLGIPSYGSYIGSALALLAAVASIVSRFKGWHSDFTRYYHAAEQAVAQEGRWRNLYKRIKSCNFESFEAIEVESQMLCEMDRQVECLMPRHDPMDDGVGAIQKEVEASLGVGKCPKTTRNKTCHNQEKESPLTKIGNASRREKNGATEEEESKERKSEK